jgi:hypothetical protein
MKLYLFPQSVADGCCLLWCIVASVKTLIDPELTIQAFSIKHRIQDKWKKLISIAPIPHKFLNGDGSDIGLPQPLEIRVITNFVDLAFRIFESRQHRFTVKRITIAQFQRKTNYSNSVIIFCLRSTAVMKCYSNAEHWVSCVSRQEQTLLLACSCSIYDCDPYEELLTADGRRYNNTMNLDQLTAKHIEHKFIFLITHLPKEKP